MNIVPPARTRRFAAALVLAALAGTPALAPAIEVSQAPDNPPPRVTFERSSLAPGNAPVLDRQGRELNEVAGVSLRWWSRHGRSDLGVGVGTLGFVPPADGPAGSGLLAPRPTLSVAWRYRLSGDTAVYADATGVHALAGDGPMPGIVNTKVGLEWKPATSRFGFENRSIGFQLQSGYRMSLRVRGGGVGVYLRGQF